MTITSTTLITPQIISFPDPITLQNGSTLPGYQLIIETYGELNESKSNAVLICHALSGTHHAAGRHHPNDKYTGWWDNMIGAGR